jgi:signal transduction histidine kinase
MKQLNIDDRRGDRFLARRHQSSKVWPVRHAAIPLAANSNLEQLAILSDRLADRSNEAAGILLAATTFMSHGGLRALQPLWAEEAMHRAYSMMRLLQRAHLRGGEGDPPMQHRDCCIATRLSENLRTLQADAMLVRTPCSRILNQTVRDLVLLFGRGANKVGIIAEIDRLTLSAYRRRALVLLANELVTNALTHAFPDGGAGMIQVSLRIIRPRLVELHVADDGIGIKEAILWSASSVAGGLASLLGGELRYCSTNLWSTRAEVLFPLGEP